MQMYIRRSRNRGFTLIELLLVLVILAVLAAVVVPKFTNRSEQARKTAAVSVVKKGLPVPAANTTMRPVARCLSARAR